MKSRSSGAFLSGRAGTDWALVPFPEDLEEIINQIDHAGRMGRMGEIVKQGKKGAAFHTRRELNWAGSDTLEGKDLGSNPPRV